MHYNYQPLLNHSQHKQTNQSIYLFSVDFVHFCSPLDWTVFVSLFFPSFEHFSQWTPISTMLIYRIESYFFSQIWSHQLKVRWFVILFMIRCRRMNSHAKWETKNKRHRKNKRSISFLLKYFFSWFWMKKKYKFKNQTNRINYKQFCQWCFHHFGIIGEKMWPTKVFCNSKSMTSLQKQSAKPLIRLEQIVIVRII